MNDHMNWRIARRKGGGVVHTTKTVMTEFPPALIEALEHFADRVERIEAQLAQLGTAGDAIQNFSTAATDASATALNAVRLVTELEPRLAVLEVRWNAYETALRKEAANAA